MRSLESNDNVPTDTHYSFFLYHHINLYKKTSREHDKHYLSHANVRISLVLNQ